MATGDIRYVAGTPIVFRDSGGTAMTLSSLPSGQARAGARYDLGTGALPALFTWFGRAQFAGAPTIDTGLEVYVGLWDDMTGPADAWGGLSGSDTAYTTTAGIAKRKSLQLLGVVGAETSAVGPFYKGGDLFRVGRYLSCFVYNASSQALASEGTFASYVRLTPWYAQVQP